MVTSRKWTEVVCLFLVDRAVTVNENMKASLFDPFQSGFMAVVLHRTDKIAINGEQAERL